MRQTIMVAAVLLAGASQSQAHASPALTEHRLAREGRCTTDGLIHAEVSPAITKHVKDSITLLEPGARVREVAKLTLPCGFHLDPRSGWNLILTNGSEVRRYIENNAFGFAPAFGFGEGTANSYTLNYRIVADGELHAESCGEMLRGIKGAPAQCTSFGSQTSMFGASPDKRMTRIAHFLVHGSAIEEDFPAAMVKGRVESIFFVPPPDAPGGTITLILADRAGMYRAFLDTPRG